MNTRDAWKSSLTEAQDTLTKFLNDPVQLDRCEKFTQILVETMQKNGKLFTCGNGGSHCDSMHFAEELTGRYRKDRRALGALALGDPSHVTCTANDFGFEHIFSRQVEGLGRPGDLLVGISTSGNSKNVINAMESAKRLGMKTVALLGKDGGKLKEIAHHSIIVPGATPDRIQEMHIKLIHTVIETMERKMFPEHYT